MIRDLEERLEAALVAAVKPLTAAQREWLSKLAEDPSTIDVPPATLAFLRRRGLVGRVVTKGGGHQRTTSPITETGAAYLRGDQ